MGQAVFSVSFRFLILQKRFRRGIRHIAKAGEDIQIELFRIAAIPTVDDFK